MKLYIAILSVGLTIIMGGNLFYVLTENKDVGAMFLYLFLAVVVCGLMSGVITLITRILPSKVFNPYRKRYKVYSKENELYNKLKIKKWKDKIPELGKLSGFAKTEIAEPNNPEYIYKFLTENCIAEALHFYSIVAGLLIFIFLPREYIFTIGLPVFFLNFLLHIMPILVQRYLRPKFLKIYNRLLIQKEKNDNEKQNQENIDEFDEKTA